jgi:hypothetical protein
VQVDEHHDFLGREPFALGAERDFGLAFDQRRLCAVHAALHLGLRRAPDDHHVVVRPRIDQRLLQPFLQHQHGSEHEYDQRHPARREQRRHLARPQVAKCI